MRRFFPSKYLFSTFPIYIFDSLNKLSLSISIAPVSVIPFLVGLLTNSFLLSTLYNMTNSLWICAMTYSLINVCSQIFEGGNTYVSYICKVVVIVLAIILSNKAIQRNNCIK